MRKIILFLICAVCALSCGSSRKYVETDTHKRDSSEVTERMAEKTVVVMDTTMTAQGTVTVTEVEFFPPDAGDSLKTANECSIGISADATALKSSGQRVKRIRQTVISSAVEKKGVVDCRDSSEIVKAERAVSVSSEAIKEEETSVPAPNPWRRICLVVLSAVVVAAVLYLKRIPVLDWIRKILSALRKIF